MFVLRYQVTCINYAYYSITASGFSISLIEIHRHWIINLVAMAYIDSWSVTAVLAAATLVVMQNSRRSPRSMNKARSFKRMQQLYRKTSPARHPRHQSKMTNNKTITSPTRDWSETTMMNNNTVTSPTKDHSKWRWWIGQFIRWRDSGLDLLLKIKNENYFFSSQMFSLSHLLFILLIHTNFRLIYWFFFVLLF